MVARRCDMEAVSLLSALPLLSFASDSHCHTGDACGPCVLDWLLFVCLLLLCNLGSSRLGRGAVCCTGGKVFGISFVISVEARTLERYSPKGIGALEYLVTIRTGQPVYLFIACSDRECAVTGDAGELIQWH